MFLGESGSTSIDLSKATKLKDVAFQPNSWNVWWVTTALRTITPNHQDLRHLSIQTPQDPNLAGAAADPGQTVGETIDRQWSDLDLLLVQFWELRSIRPEVTYPTGQRMRDFVGNLLPEITKRGIVDLVAVHPEC